MLSATSRTASRPRPPGQRRPSPEHQPAPTLDTNTCIDAHLEHPKSKPSRTALSDMKNLVHLKSSEPFDFDVDKLVSRLRHHEQVPAHDSPAYPYGNAPQDAAFEPESLTPSTSEEVLDHAYLGGLDRYELEELLIEASRKVRQREKKLVVAANIGKALLEKNLNLRSGIMTSMASSSSLVGLTDIEAMINDISDPQDPAYLRQQDDVDNHTPYSASHPINSPPTTDIDIHSQGHLSPRRSDTDITPLAQPIALPSTELDYFSRPVSTALQTSHPSHASMGDAYWHNSDKSMWVPSDAGLITSQPCSPSASISSFASHALLSPANTMSRVHSKRDASSSRHRSRPSLLQLQALEAQRQLASLGEQNDVLHQQISELQHEAESARYQGSKKLGRLNKEIRGLKAELEAATRRNVELETHGHPSRPTSATRSPLRHPVAHHRQDPASPLVFPAKARHTTVASTLASAEPRAIAEEPSPNHHGLVPSTSNLEDLVRSALTTDGESALLAQLLAKIKELEETNSAMTKAEEDFGSRMGRAMEEDERLRDAFNSVGQDLSVDAIAQASCTSPGKTQGASGPLSMMGSPSKRTSLQSDFITPSHCLRSLDSVESADAPRLVSSASPNARRRAPGNRHVIEHRKTVKLAIRRAKKELAADIWGIHGDESPVTDGRLSRSSTERSLGTYSIDLCGSGSASSSPRQWGLNRKASSNSIALGPAGRPRIRITPSIEDLGCRRKMQEQVIAGPPLETSAAADWQDVANPITPTFPQHSSLSPSYAIQAYSSRSQRIDTQDDNVKDSCSANENPSKLNAVSQRNDTIPYLSPMQQMSFHPTARVRRKRSKTSSFGLEASLIRQSPDPFISPSSAWSRPVLQRSPASTSSHHGRTLGSELGSIFGGDDRKHDLDDDLPQHRRPATSSSSDSDKTTLQPLVLRSVSSTSALELRSKIITEVKSDRPTAHYGRLVPENKQEQEDDLECVLAQSVYGNVEDVFLDDSPLRPRDATLLARVEAREQGNWLADQPIIEEGQLQGGDEPRGAQFDLINAVVEQEAVAWADDDDYGRTISQREAVRLGLLAPGTPPLASRSARLLKGKSNQGASIFGMSRAFNSKKQKQGGASKDVTHFRLEIESSEQIKHRLRIESLLRRRRQDLVRERGFDHEWEYDAHDEQHEEQILATYAPTPQKLQEKRRQALAAGPTDELPSRRDPQRSTQRWMRDLACISPIRKGQPACEALDLECDQDRSLMGLDFVRPEDGEFELLDCPTWKKQGGRGTDYFPTSFRARYHPAMVKQRVVHVSQATYGWVEEWVQFVFVVFLTFVVVVERGPNRSVRRGKPTPPALATLLPKAD
ncbi:hypothetical protein NDA18_006348 [Ustilago nuda]|nr:hypothetical protein NDA18_006348 [Ustilago nuda]